MKLKRLVSPRFLIPLDGTDRDQWLKISCGGSYVMRWLGKAPRGGTDKHEAARAIGH